VYAVDVDGDGDLDLATANWASGDVSVLRNGRTSEVPGDEEAGIASNGLWLGNPSVGDMQVLFSVERSCHVELKMYDTAGRMVGELANRIVAAGEHEVIWDWRDVPSGVYFCTMRAEGYSAVKRVVSVK